MHRSVILIRNLSNLNNKPLKIMYTPSRISGFFDNVRNSENLKNVPSFDPGNNIPDMYNGYFDSYAPVYAPSLGYEHDPNYLSGIDYENAEEFPSLLTSQPPGFINDDYYPPPGFSKNLKTKAPNPNAVSFIPSYLSTPPLKDGKEEQESKEYGVRAILTLQKNLPEDKALLAKGKDLSVLEIKKNNLECISSYFNSSQLELEIDSSELPEYTLPASYYLSKPILKAKMIKTYHIETLFYIFYNMPGELVQSYVADELYKREWLYDPKKQVWFTNTGGEWKTFDINRFEVVAASQNPGPFLSKDDVCVKQRTLA